MSTQREKNRLGRFGEEIAALHLGQDGMTVIDRNWRCQQGELDLIAREKRGTVVFCEVKTRRTERHGTPFEAVNEAKARRIRRLAAEWLREHPGSGERLRFDVIGVVVPADGPVQLRHRREVL